MNSYAVFLRGINVGGINIKMAALKDALAAAGFDGVKTLLASGNVVLASDDGPAAVKQKFEKCLRDTFGYDAWVVVLTAQRVGELVEACPYPEDDKTTHTYITLASDTARLDELDAAGAALDGTDQTRLGPEALAWLAPVGGTLDSPFSKVSAKPKFKASTTTRNLRTLIKVRDAAAAVA
ncbi:MAG: pyridoxamine 5-phosphate oxidase [Pseudarthrobacter sp.]|nr:pyridoxamine 5-phosphate oxidase [Pseudarthrobacter sp.]